MAKIAGHNTLKFECIHCGRVHEVDVPDGAGIKKGTVIEPHSGGGHYGRCRFCKRAGLRALEEITPPKKEAMGWRTPKKRRSTKTES